MSIIERKIVAGVLQNVDIQAKADVVRRAELEALGKKIGEGLPYQCNACCADSLLQAMAFHGWVRQDLLTNRRAREIACRACRAHLVNHIDPRLHPRRRTHTGAVDLHATDEEHNGAYLQSDVHSESIV